MNRRIIKIMMLCVSGLVLVQLLGYLFPKKYLWINVTQSEPVGLYRMTAFTGRLNRGEMIVMEVPPPFRGYVYGRNWLPEGWPLFKQVGGIPGDLFCVADASLSINGTYVGPVYRFDGKGQTLPQMNGCRRVPPGHFLPIATGIRNSFDGRYMGPVAVTAIKGVVKPIITF